MWFGFLKALNGLQKPVPDPATLNAARPTPGPSSTPLRTGPGPGKSTGAPAGLNARQSAGDSANNDQDTQFIARSPQLDSQDKYDSRLSKDPDESTSSVAWWSIGSLGEQALHDLDNLRPDE
jgi:hypothetical protein